mmetsp:Transcript_91580/g.200752  ORF Transcript_91580/g.200752 Transcript_91580/m.200752 type:complete len:369 (-) Transcript_91580:42-1148(-)
MASCSAASGKTVPSSKQNLWLSKSALFASLLIFAAGMTLDLLGVMLLLLLLLLLMVWLLSLLWLLMPELGTLSGTSSWPSLVGSAEVSRGNLEASMGTSFPKVLWEDVGVEIDAIFEVCAAGIEVVGAAEEDEDEEEDEDDEDEEDGDLDLVRDRDRDGPSFFVVCCARPGLSAARPRAERARDAVAAFAFVDVAVAVVFAPFGVDGRVFLELAPTIAADAFAFFAFVDAEAGVVVTAAFEEGREDGGVGFGAKVAFPFFLSVTSAGWTGDGAAFGPAFRGIFFTFPESGHGVSTFIFSRSLDRFSAMVPTYAVRSDSRRLWEMKLQTSNKALGHEASNKASGNEASLTRLRDTTLPTTRLWDTTKLL